MKKKSGKNGKQEDLVNPLEIENLKGSIKIRFNVKDLLQIIIGASVLSVPVGFTEETWSLGSTLPMLNIILLLILTLIFITIFTYFHYHQEHMHANPRHHLLELTKRVFVTYVFSFGVVALLLGLIQVTPWSTDAVIAFKRIVVVTFPCAMGATLSDTIK